MSNFKSIVAVVSVILANSLWTLPVCGETPTVKASSANQSSTVDYLKIPFTTIAGDTTNLAAFSGKVVLIVNVASECGNTPQYAGLEKLYRTYKDSGLVVIGFPANNFGGQEPGTNEQILKFCTATYNVSFPMMAKVSVKGNDKHSLFTALTEKSNMAGEIRWNFSKFLLDRHGNLVARFDPAVQPDSEQLLSAIRKLL
jgi:glutathione peroxidase